MAVDTPTKRASALFVRTRARRFLPLPDGTIAVADRAHLAAVYYLESVDVPPSSGWRATPLNRVAVADNTQRLVVAEQFNRVVIAYPEDPR